MTILVSGSSGFLGKKIINLLKSKKIDFLVCSNKSKKLSNFIHINDLSNQNTINKYKNKITIFIHFATVYDVDGIKDEEILNANVIYGLKFFNFAKKINTKYFLNLDTMLSPHINRYAFSKYIFKELINNFNQKKIKIINLNMDMMFGYKDKRFFDQFIEKLIKKENKIKLTSCNQYRNITHVDNIVDQIFFIINNIKKIKNGDINLGSSKEIKMKEFILIIIEEINEITKNDFKSRILFGSIKDRKGERKLEKFICDNYFKNETKKEYKKKLKVLIHSDIKKYYL